MLVLEQLWEVLFSMYLLSLASVLSSATRYLTSLLLIPNSPKPNKVDSIILLYFSAHKIIMVALIPRFFILSGINRYSDRCDVGF